MQSLKLLLDTHTLLWTIGKTKELSDIVYKAIKNTDNDVFASAVSLWEIALKFSLGKLKVNFDIKEIPMYCDTMGIELIPLLPSEALNSLLLPVKEHKDPFDRMLIYQCITNGYILISKDTKMEIYKNEG